MHLTILFGSSFASDDALAVLMFSALKTGADVLMHVVEHRVLQRQATNLEASSNEDTTKRTQSGY